jgi:hypothetical protein
VRFRTWWLWCLSVNVIAFAVSIAVSLRNYLDEHVGRRAFVRDWAPNLFWPIIISLLTAALAINVGKPAILGSIALAAGVIGLRFHVYEGDGYYARLITALTAPRNADILHSSFPIACIFLAVGSAGIGLLGAMASHRRYRR